MKQIKIINGTYGWHPRPNVVEPVEAGGVCTVSEDEAERLVRLKVAKVVNDIMEETATPPVATGQDGEGGVAAGNDTPDSENGAEVDGDAGAHLDVDELMEMTKADMEKLAEDMGVDITGAKTKVDIAALIAAVPVDISDDEDDSTPPDLAPEAPVS